MKGTLELPYAVIPSVFIFAAVFSLYCMLGKDHLCQWISLKAFVTLFMPVTVTI